jgi:hypothetical protein
LKEYIDPVCLDQGSDHPDSIGTEMRQFSLYDEIISTPEKFKKVLLNNRYYIYIIKLLGDIKSNIYI